MDLKIIVNGKPRLAKNVPDTTWKSLEPYWPALATAILEVTLNNDFLPRHVTQEYEDGFYATEPYWERHERNPRQYPLTEAKRFVSLIKKKESFVSALREFNKPKNLDWLSDRDEIQFRKFVGNCCWQLEDYIFRYVEESFEKGS